MKMLPRGLVYQMDLELFVEGSDFHNQISDKISGFTLSWLLSLSHIPPLLLSTHKWVAGLSSDTEQNQQILRNQTGCDTGH